jgi:hypothetical protein
VGIEQFHHLGKIGQRPGQPIDLIYHHYIDHLLLDVSQQFLQCRTLHSPARKTAIVVMVLYQVPALTRLAADEGLTGIALGVERIEILLQSLFGGLTGIDGAAPTPGFSWLY